MLRVWTGLGRQKLPNNESAVRARIPGSSGKGLHLSVVRGVRHFSLVKVHINMTNILHLLADRLYLSAFVHAVAPKRFRVNSPALLYSRV